MEQFNKVLSFILGLIVVAVFIVFASGKYSLKGIKLPGVKTTTAITPTLKPTPTATQKKENWFTRLFAKPSPTPTPVQGGIAQKQPQNKPTQAAGLQEQTDTGTQTMGTKGAGESPEYHRYTVNQQPTSIPSTGVPLVFFPITISSLIGGIYLRNKVK